MEHITAKVSCFARAYHYRNHPVPIFADPLAEQLLGPDYDQIAQSMTQGISFFLPDFHGSEEEGLQLIVDRQLSPSVLGRSAYCERMLENEIRLGCRQYVIFASGYDTFAMRHQDPSLCIYELDLADMLADKRRRAERAGLKTAGIYVPCDLSEETWKDRLIGSGFACERKSFGSLLGISYYLEKDEFWKFLRALGEIMCEGSAICFDYPCTEESQETRINQTLAMGAGEKMKARYSSQDMAAILEAGGFLVYEQLGDEEMTKEYFWDHNIQSPAHRMVAPKGVSYVLAVRGKTEIGLKL